MLFIYPGRFEFDDAKKKTGNKAPKINKGYSRSWHNYLTAKPNSKE